MLDMAALQRLSSVYDVPLEDVVLIALNTNGVRYACDYHRMRTPFRFGSPDLFPTAFEREETGFYLALPVTLTSPFAVDGQTLSLGEVPIGTVKRPTEDICDSHYLRRNRTSLNLNANSRTTCRGCSFCYTAYQKSGDLKKLVTAADVREFFDGWLADNNLTDLSHLIQVSLVTGCYDSSEDLIAFLRTLRRVLDEYRFAGRIFYLGSQITTSDQLQQLSELGSIGLCYSLEVFERRNVLRPSKKRFGLDDLQASMDQARSLDFEVNFSYIVGMEPLPVLERHFDAMREHINKFPTINTLQVHHGQSAALVDPTAHNVGYYLEVRRLLERLFADTPLRPLVWEDYRSLWFLDFNGRPLASWRAS